MTDIKLKDPDKAVFRRLHSTGRISNALQRTMTQQYNRCSLCGKAIENGRPAFAGYCEALEPILTCAECAGALFELATPVYWTRTLDLSVDEKQSLWRYMDFSKFVAMMQQGGLFFTRASNFDDPFEAAAGIASREDVWNDHYLKFFRNAVRNPPPGYPATDMTEPTVEQEAIRLLREIKTAYASARNLLVNCWNMNNVESEAFWKIYCPPGAPGVAIQTNVAQLWGALENEPGANIGAVQYIDFRKKFAPGDQRIYCKRSSIVHEREFRSVLPNEVQNLAEGRIIRCDLNTLIEGVVISPYAPYWFHKVVKETVSKFRCDFIVRSSEIGEAPFY